MRCLARRRAPATRTPPSRRRARAGPPLWSPPRGAPAYSLLAPPGDADGTRERDGFFVDGLVEPVEHDRAGVERTHGPLPHPPLTLFVSSVGGDGLHHDAGVLDVHGNVAGEDLQSLVRQP